MCRNNSRLYNHRVKHEHFDDPVAAYDRIGKHYAELARRRESYLRSVGNCILQRLPAGCGSLLDVGSGDGVRALRIAAEARIKRVVLVEPSAAMVSPLKHQPEIWQCRAENLDPSQIRERFDVITCLWNVLGHVPPSARPTAVINIARLLAPEATFFIDINHRYNARAHGFLSTGLRWFCDRYAQNITTSDVRATWKLPEATVSTYGHVFTHREMLDLSRTAGLELTERIVVDYSNGEIRRWAFGGNLLYVFRRCS
jgi:2-polyprenyl-3-methyl-5-hydroxy-6-metoxy-1,4-benzoquinol methylase